MDGSDRVTGSMSWLSRGSIVTLLGAALVLVGAPNAAGRIPGEPLLDSVAYSALAAVGLLLAGIGIAAGRRRSRAIAGIALIAAGAAFLLPWLRAVESDAQHSLLIGYLVISTLGIAALAIASTGAGRAIVAVGASGSALLTYLTATHAPTDQLLLNLLTLLVGLALLVPVFEATPDRAAIGFDAADNAPGFADPRFHASQG